MELMFELDPLYEMCSANKNVVLFGGGEVGQELIKKLRSRKTNVLAVFSNYPEKDKVAVKNIPVMYPCKEYENLTPLYIIAVLNEEVQKELKKQLHLIGISTKRIITISEIRYMCFSTYGYDQRKKYLSKLYYNEFSRELNWDSPSYYSEILNYEKLHHSKDVIAKYTVLADKLAVREYVKKRIGERYLPKLIGSWNRAEEIDMHSLPNSFVLKCNHGSGMNIVVKDKNELDWESAKQQLDEWVEHCYPYITGNFEVQYEGIPRKILCEEYIEGLSKNNPQYNVFCFDGEPLWIWRLRGPHTVEERGRFYNTEWKTKDFYCGYPLDPEVVSKPENLDEILLIAKKLSEGIKHVRVDIYELTNKQLAFSEMTFSTWSGLKKFVPDEYDLMFGELIRYRKN